MTSPVERRKELEQVRIDYEIKKARNVLYVRLLFFLGIVSILGSIIMLTTEAYFFFGQGIGFMSVGVALVIMGLIWQYSDQNRLEKIDEDIEHTREEEMQGIRDASERH